MKEKLDSIIRTINEAQRRLQEAKDLHSDGEGSDGEGTLDEVEMGLEWIMRKLEKMKENDSAGV